MQLEPYYAFRSLLVDALVRDLIGPGGELELLKEEPITRYVTGILYPQDAPVDAADDVDAIEDDEEGTVDPPVALANLRYPSSMGMTFAVDSRCPEVVVAVKAARYVEETPPAEDEPVESGSPRRLGRPSKWRREPLDIPPKSLDLTSPKSALRIPLADGLELFARIRTADACGAVSVTVGLLNTRTAGPSGIRDADAFFQPVITLHGPNGFDAPFIERSKPASMTDDEEVRTFGLVYRHSREFATGHGCSVEWEVSPNDDGRAVSIQTSFAPTYELNLAESNASIQLESLKMKFLGEAPRASVVDDLRNLVTGYRAWLEGQRKIGASLLAEERTTAERHLEACEEAASRIDHGIDLLGSDDVAWEAFRLMNEAMLEQRARTEWIRAGCPSGGPDRGETHRWRPFQLAFILLCIPGIVDLESPDRDIADLLWFPTGGGKTEAYLGLVAFTAFARRLRGDDAGGVTALMRYTLRLLTIQQFERAALLICCCEKIRRINGNLGADPVSIGLWVGEGATPNTRKDARRSLDALRSDAVLERANPMQLHSCPWCGAALGHRNYYLATSPERLVIACRKEDCLFGDGLPAYVVDEDIYDFRPTLIVGTVDKFASLPWRQSVASLFNSDRPDAKKPELIIQDELHLISGPLGTLVGLYETAVDVLCQDGGRPAKVIASTATIRRASEQVRCLFNRRIRQFPPAALDARDSYFAVEVPRQEKGTRCYVGLMAPGKSHTWLMVRTYAALLQTAADLPAADEIKDPYWTLVGYFNSLRVLGGARMQVQDDVEAHMEVLARRSETQKRPIDERIELTSREPSGNIPSHLKQMQKGLPSDRALDVILATNMISVGVDIDRLGLMVVMGQPQSTSEYIQSTSRVGRRYPGLVVALFNSARSRDRSHYESFVTYHSTLYRQVESTSVTPYSTQARVRGLHAVVIALARLLLPAFGPNSGASVVENRVNELETIKQLILLRVREVDPCEEDAVRHELDQIIGAWRSRAQESDELVYFKYGQPSHSLLVPAADVGQVEDGEAFPTLWSLRDVDLQSNLYLVREHDG